MSDMQTLVHVEDGHTIFQNVQDCTPIAEYAIAQHNAGYTGSSEMKHAARIPMVMVEKYLNDNNITFSEWSGNKDHIRRMLQDPALEHFRIWKGKI